MREITLSQSRVALVDDEDYDFLNQWKWHYQKDPRIQDLGYAVRLQRIPGTNKFIGFRMHRLVLERKLVIQLTNKDFVDHRDHNGINNTRNNLRLSTISQNGMNRKIQINNSSGYKGVRWHKTAKRWVAQIYINGKSQYLGAFDDIEEAARTYDQKAVELFGEFAKLNFKSL